MRLDAEKQEHIAKLYKLAQVKGEKLVPESNALFTCSDIRVHFTQSLHRYKDYIKH